MRIYFVSKRHCDLLMSFFPSIFVFVFDNFLVVIDFMLEKNHLRIREGFIKWKQNGFFYIINSFLLSIRST